MSTATVFYGAGVNHCINNAGWVHAAQTTLLVVSG
jgi:hypothetical protein